MKYSIAVFVMMHLYIIVKYFSLKSDCARAFYKFL